MATYSDIQVEVQRSHGFYAQPCWIAQTKEQLGMPVKNAPNRRDPSKRVKVCPADKAIAIQEAMKTLGMLD